METNKQSAGPDVLLTVFAFAQDLQFMGELNFDLDGRQGAAGCIYEAKQCSFAFQKTNQHHSGDKGIMIRAKYSPNPVQMIDPVAQKILATFKLFDGERMKEEGVKKAICRKFLCEEGWGDDFKAFADEQGVVAIKKGLKLEKMDESTYKASGFYYSKDKDPSEGGVILTVTFKGGQWAVADVSFEE